MSNIIPVPNFEKIAHYPKTLAFAENIGNIKNVNTEDNDKLPEFLNDLALKNKESFTRSYFEYFGAYPYVFEAVAYALTQLPREKAKEYITPVEDGLFFEMKFSWETFKDYALDGMPNQTDNLIQRLKEMALNPQGKVIPISPTQTITTTPIRITLISEDGRNLSNQEIKRLENLNKTTLNNGLDRLPIKGLYIQCFTPFFADLLKGQYGENWFPIPKAFYAKMIETQRKYRNDEEISKIDVKGNPATYRKLFLYMFMHDNKMGNQLNFDCIDLWKSVSPKEIQYQVNKSGEKIAYLKRKEDARKFIYKGNLLLNRMAREGFLDGVTFAPNKVFCDYDKMKYTVFLKRVPKDIKDYKLIEAMPKEEN